ncbi:CHAT domain-containing protein [Mycena crocata]|nr:CHAT domain-containing protein [Mycena crocata]
MAMPPLFSQTVKAEGILCLIHTLASLTLLRAWMTRPVKFTVVTVSLSLCRQESPTLTEFRQAVQEGGPDLPAHLQNLAIYFAERYQKLGNDQDIENALGYFRAAVELMPAGHQYLPSCLHDMGMALGDRFLRRGNIEDLEEALKNSADAVARAAADDPDRGRYLQTLGACHRDRYKRLGRVADLEAALKYKDASNLAVSFSDRYDRFGRIEDLDAALANYRAAVAQIPRNHPELPGYLQSLGFGLSARYHRMGELTDLQAAIENKEQAVKRTRPEHTLLPECAQSLGVAQFDRYRRLGDYADLRNAGDNFLRALASTPPAHPTVLRHLKNLALALREWYRISEDDEHINLAVQRIREAIQAMPLNSPDLGGSLHCLALCHRDRYETKQNADDLESAMENFAAAIERTPEGHPELASRLQDLSVAVRLRFETFGDVSDLETAMQRSDRAVFLTPPDHPDLSSRIHGLVNCLVQRYDILRDPKDVKSALSNYRKSFDMPTSQPWKAWSAALKWAALAKEHNEPDACLEAYTAAFRLLPHILWVGNSLMVHQFASRRNYITRATPEAPSTDRCQPAGVPLLATVQRSVGNPKAFATEREELLKNIRKRPGFERFLLPQLYAQLRQVASQGPVVILNAHQKHCDAIILISGIANPIHVALPHVTLAELEQQRRVLADLIRGRGIRNRGSASMRLKGVREGARSSEELFGDVLKWLWAHVVSCIYVALDSHGIRSGRLWSCPVGAFAGLPLHAAAPSDDFVQSYTSTLGGLLIARARHSVIRGSSTIGIVGVAHIGPNQEAQLAYVSREIEKIESVFGPARVQKLIDDAATVEAVKSQLQSCAWIHLACHEKQDDQRPPKSHLKLYGGNLELETILRMSLTSEVVFLSACQTAMGDAHLVNEAFHLAGGFVAAGFRGAIGTMWSIMDHDGPGVAESVYSHLFAASDGMTLRATDAAKALQLATRKMRDKRVGYERWVPFAELKWRGSVAETKPHNASFQAWLEFQTLDDALRLFADVVMSRQRNSSTNHHLLLLPPQSKYRKAKKSNGASYQSVLMQANSVYLQFSVDTTHTEKAARSKDRGRIAELAAQILDLERSLRLLQGEKDLAQKRLDSYVYPVFLPNEIISEIFVRFLPAYPRSLPLKGRSSPTLLTQICRIWRDIAHDTPLLWRAISLVHRKRTRDERDTRLLEPWMSRSHSYPISIYIETEDTLPSQCMETLAAHRARWEHLQLAWIDETAVSFLGNPMPLLRHLDLSFDEECESIFLGDAPLLQSARLVCSPDVIVLPWRQLTSLVLDGLHPDQCAQILQQTTLLVDCKLSLWTRHDDRDRQPDVELPFLKSLVVIKEQTLQAPFLYSLIIPALRTLRVPHSDLGPDPIGGLRSFIAQSKCTLQELHIAGKRSLVDTFDYRQAFPTIPQLTFAPPAPKYPGRGRGLPR